MPDINSRPHRGGERAGKSNLSRLTPLRSGRFSPRLQGSRRIGRPISADLADGQDHALVKNVVIGVGEGVSETGDQPRRKTMLGDDLRGNVVHGGVDGDERALDGISDLCV
ncbi:MAG TPA: hypothetical protein VII73_01010 [Caulobacteraceae bacterium]